METRELWLRAGECFEQTKNVFSSCAAFRIRNFCNLSVYLFSRSSTNTRKSYGKMQESSNASNGRTSINLSTVRNSKCIYYYIFGAFYMVKTLKYSIILFCRLFLRFTSVFSCFSGQKLHLLRYFCSFSRVLDVAMGF